MAYSSRDRDAYAQEGSLGSATSSLVGIIGGFGNISGPSLFMLRMLVNGTASAVAFGLTGSTISAIVFGTASIPWMVCSSIGFAIGTFGAYRDALRKAFIAVDLYPRLLQLHLDLNYPGQGFNKWDRQRIRSSEFSGSWTMKSMLVASWMTAQGGIDQIFDARQQKSIDEAGQESELVKEQYKDSQTEE